jgi:ketosteroid isomerase-like protein
MKTIRPVVLILTLLLFSACGPRVNDPATAKALEDLNKGYNEAINSRDLDWIRVNYYTDDAVMLPAHQLLLKGKEAVLARDQALFEQYGTIQFNSSIEEILSSGDLAVARGGFIWTGTPDESGLSDVRMEGKWIGTFNRQDDGLWKCTQIIWNSDQPAEGKTADGTAEEDLLQIERDWTSAVINKNREVLDNILAKDYVGNSDEGVRNKRQALASVMSSALKIESLENSDMQPMVFGDTGVVYGMVSAMGKRSGKDISGKYRFTDIYEKRDGNWKCVASYSAQVK